MKAIGGTVAGITTLIMIMVTMIMVVMMMIMLIRTTIMGCDDDNNFLDGFSYIDDDLESSNICCPTYFSSLHAKGSLDEWFYFVRREDSLG